MFDPFVLKQCFLKSFYIYLLQEEDLSIVHTEPREISKPDPIKTSTPALFSTPGIKRRPNTTIFGEPLPEASTSQEANASRPQLFSPLSESRPQPFSLPKSRPSFSVAAFGSPLPVSTLHLHLIYLKTILQLCGRRSGLVVSTLDSGSTGPGSSAGQAIVLCSWVRHFTLTVPLSTQE